MCCFPFSIRQISAVVFRLMLVVSLWNGPVLWGHTHVCGTGELSAHVACFHAQDDTPTLMDWHWHCSFPQEDQDHEPNPQHQHRMETSVVLNSVDSQNLTVSDGCVCAPLADQIMTLVAPEILAQAGGSVEISRLHSGLSRQALCRMSC